MAALGSGHCKKQRVEHITNGVCARNLPMGRCQGTYISKRIVTYCNQYCLNEYETTPTQSKPCRFVITRRQGREIDGYCTEPSWTVREKMCMPNPDNDEINNNQGTR